MLINQYIFYVLSKKHMTIKLVQNN